MATKFKLLVSQHIGPDLSQPCLKDKDGKDTDRHPSKTFNAGDVVEAEEDLVAKCGADKFQKLEGEPMSPPKSATAPVHPTQAGHHPTHSASAHAPVSKGK